MIPPLVAAGLVLVLGGAAAIALGSFRTKDVGFVAILLGLVAIALGAGLA